MKVAASGATIAIVVITSATGWAQMSDSNGRGGANAARPAVAERAEGYLTRPVAAPDGAIELTVATGYTQGFGMLQRGLSVPDVATPGIGFDAGVAYRLDPRWSIGLVGQYQELTAERANGARALAGTVAAGYHFAPYIASDPWVSFGIGYRSLWERDIGNGSNADVTTHGFQLGRLTAGFDVRLSEDVAVSPIIGADLNLFLWQRALGQSSAIADPGVNTFVFAGAQGRFDIGGNRAASPDDREPRTARR